MAEVLVLPSALVRTGSPLLVAPLARSRAL